MDASDTLAALAAASGYLLPGLAAAGCLYTLIAAALVGRYRARPLPAAAAPMPAITVLKPLKGAEPRLFENLETLLRQDYPGIVQILFGVSDAHDPAVAAVQALQRAFPAASIELVVDARRHGSNAKVSNLVNIAAHASHPIIVLADSDVAWPPDTLRRLVAALAAAGTGLVSCVHHGRGDAGVWSLLGAMDISYRFLPSVAVGIATGLATPCLGPTLALRRDTLDRIGGFIAFADVLADDYAMGEAVRAQGLATVVPRFTICHSGADGSARALVAHELRWTRTIYGIDPAGFAGSLLTHPLPLALAGAVAAGFDMLTIAVVGAAAACRLVLMCAVDWATGTGAGLRARHISLMLLRDLLSAGLFVATFFVKDVIWRETRYRVQRNGYIQRL